MQPGIITADITMEIPGAPVTTLDLGTESLYVNLVTGVSINF